jgi:hypothetical protein
MKDLEMMLGKAGWLCRIGKFVGLASGLLGCTLSRVDTVQRMQYCSNTGG